MAAPVNNRPAGPPPVPVFSRARLRRLADELLSWFEVSQRDLPWRRRRDPYAIWVSEVMLQQTRVEAVVGPYERFLARFPDVHALARAQEAEVLAQWAGLGYYRRARQLHAAATRIVDQAGGVFPRSAAALRLLPGFGPYTAGAVASIAFGEAVPAIDGNVQRVLSRLLALEEDPVRGSGARTVEVLARELLQGVPADRVNQALMELGALTCTPRAPRCEECPWRRSCRARAAGVVELLPRKAPRVESSVVSCYAAVVCRGQDYLWRRRPPEGHNEGLWELPTTVWHGGEPETDRSAAELRQLGESLGRRWEVGESLALVRHSITRYRVRCVGHRVEDHDSGVGEALRWATFAEAQELGLTAAARKLVEKLPRLL